MSRKYSRSKGFDYSSDNIYFITTIVKNRRPCFGEFMDGQLDLNHHGSIAENRIIWLQDQYPYLIIHAHQVMPDHVHILIEINRKVGWNAWKSRYKVENYLIGKCLLIKYFDCPNPPVRVGRDRPLQWGGMAIDNKIKASRDRRFHAGTKGFTSNLSLDFRKFKIKSISEIMGVYKSIVTREIRNNGRTDFAWQRYFYDVVVRDFKALKTIEEYIIQNPKPPL